MLRLGRYSIGIGDRFGCEGKAQLQACAAAAKLGARIVPVWNKSNREHDIVGSHPNAVRVEADTAVRELGWTAPYHVDADHINLGTVDRFMASSDFFTIDVARTIGAAVQETDVNGFVDRHPELIGTLGVEGLTEPMSIRPEERRRVAGIFLAAIKEAGAIYRHIANAKGAGDFITEVSMDETEAPQTPVELLMILAGLSDEGIPLQTVAPKFTGRFNKGVDYVGDLGRFEREMNDDLAVIAHAVRRYRLPENLKLSVHSGSDKFSIYPLIRRAITRAGAGIHLKTAGTTWLEELIGLAEAEGEGLELAKHIYAEAYRHREGLCTPYSAVIDIQEVKLPPPREVAGWSGKQYVHALRHDADCREFNPHFRQLLHVGYKIAANLGEVYLKRIRECRATISRNVTLNLFERHLKPLFTGPASSGKAPEG